MHLDRIADSAGERDVQQSAQVFAELLESLDHGQLTVFVVLRQQGVDDRQASVKQARQQLEPLLGGDEFKLDGRACIDGESDADGLSVTEFVRGFDFQPMRKPMPEIERPRGAHLEGVTARADMLQMQFSRADDERFHRGSIAIPQGMGRCAERIEEGPVFDHRDLEGFGDSASPVDVAECVE